MNPASRPRSLSRLAVMAGLTLLACARTDLPFNPSATSTPTTLADPRTQSPEPSLPAATEAPTATATLVPPTATPSASPTATATASPTPASGIRFSASGASIEYSVPLTLRHVTEGSATFFFELRSPAPGYLLYRPTAGPDAWFLIPLDPGAIRHEIVVDGLTPGSRYQARVGLGENLTDLRAPLLLGASWREVVFDTPEPEEAELRIGVIGDSGFGQRVTRDLADLMATYNLDFVLHTGDLAYRLNEDDSPPEGYAAKFFQPLAGLFDELAVYPVPGNHDYDRETYWNDRPFYFSAFAGVGFPSDEPWYSFARAGVQFLMLDSQVFHGAAGRAGQTAWLSERLADPAYRFSIPVFHTPPFTSGRHTHDGRALAAEWLPRFEAAGVPLVLSGHDHNYERILFNDVTYLVSGGGSGTLYAKTESVPGSQAFERQTHFVYLRITTDRIQIQAINLDDEIIDRATIELSPGG